MHATSKLCQNSPRKHHHQRTRKVEDTRVLYGRQVEPVACIFVRGVIHPCLKSKSTVNLPFAPSLRLCFLSKKAAGGPIPKPVGMCLGPTWPVVLTPYHSPFVGYVAEHVILPIRERVVAFHLFERFGVELEYMVVDRETLAVRPVVDQLLHLANRDLEGELPEGEDPLWPGSVCFPKDGPAGVCWSNELTLHVVEFKTAEPAQTLSGLDSAFATNVTRANKILDSMKAMLMPTGMHPWMDPAKEMVLWPHGYNDVYATFNRIFDCSGHGWANLQSCHLNLPFEGCDHEGDEFGRLHAAIRVLLAIMPALTASSPMKDGEITGFLDTRLEVYRTNSARIPQTAGKVIPERVYTKSEYERQILHPIYDAYAPFDPDGILRDEWANSRGAIARFSRGAIEVRVLDVQECPNADLAVVALISSVLRSLVDGKLGDLMAAQRAEVDGLHSILLDVIREGDAAVITNGEYLRMLGISASSMRVRDVWDHLIAKTIANTPEWSQWSRAIGTIQEHGSLSRRILRALSSGRDAKSVYRELAECLHHNRQFAP